MTKMWIAAALAGLAMAVPARAEDYGQYPAPLPGAPVPHSRLTGRFVCVPPYGLFPVRVYDTPQAGPYYNVPPYRVVAPY